MKINAYIDGFNLYYAIRNLKTPKFKWINLRTLCALFLQNEDELQDVFLFTARIKYDQNNPNKKKRQEAFIKAQMAVNVKLVFGKFKNKFPKCSHCHQQYHTYEEKESDINIALQLLEDAYEDRFDKAFVITADTDLNSTLHRVKALFPHKKIILLIPPKKSKEARDLLSENIGFEIKNHHLNKALLPEELFYNGENIKKPIEWK